METLVPTRSAALATARTTLAANFCCRPDDFLADGILFVEAGIRQGRLRYHVGDPHLGVATFGAGVVVTASPPWLPWARRALGRLDRDEVFSASCLGRVERHVRRSGQVLAGPQHRYVCADDLWREVPVPSEVEVELVAGPENAGLFRQLAVEFPYALSCAPRPERPDVVATLARSDGRVVGVAGASADIDVMWQIGIGVTPAFRGRGVAAALVSGCAGEILRQGRVPFYSTALSHLRSQSVALRAGFVPAWTEVYVHVPRGERGPLRDVLVAPGDDDAGGEGEILGVGVQLGDHVVAPARGAVLDQGAQAGADHPLRGTDAGVVAQGGQHVDAGGRAGPVSGPRESRRATTRSVEPTPRSPRASASRPSDVRPCPPRGRSEADKVSR